MFCSTVIAVNMVNASNNAVKCYWTHFLCIKGLPLVKLGIWFTKKIRFYAILGQRKVFIATELGFKEKINGFMTFGPTPFLYPHWINWHHNMRYNKTNRHFYICECVSSLSTYACLLEYLIGPTGSWVVGALIFWIYECTHTTFPIFLTLD